MNSPTSRSLAHLRKLGFTVGITEKWNPYAHIRQDLFGCIDMVAIKKDVKGVLGIQTTSDTNIAHRVEKVLPMLSLWVWLSAENRFLIQGWGKKGKRGEVKKWQLREVEIKLSDLKK